MSDIDEDFNRLTAERDEAHRLFIKWEAEAALLTLERDSLRSRIESLVEEREELLALMEEGYEVLTRTYKTDPLSAWYVKLRSVLSSRETTDSPTCPTCGSDDPAKRLCTSCHPVGSGFDAFMHHEACTDTFHSTDRGKEDS